MIFRRPPKFQTSAEKVFSGNQNAGDKLSPTGIDVGAGRSNIDYSVEAPIDPNNPFQREANVLKQVQGNNYKAYKVIDLNPYTMSLNDFRCSLNPSFVNDLIGTEIDDLKIGGYEANILAYWRTIRLDVAGTFLKIEYLPVRNNDQLNVETVSDQLPVSDQTTPIDFFNALGGGGSYGKRQSEPIVLVQFENNNEAPLIAKDGDVFKNPFNTIYLSFKTRSPRIRVIVGSNAEIVSNDSKEIVNRDLALGPGLGLWKYSHLHAVPFCITHAAISGSTLTYPTVGANTTVTYDLIKNINSSGNVVYQPGIGVVWITGIHFQLSQTVDSVAIGDFDLYLQSSSGRVKTVDFTSCREYHYPSTLHACEIVKQLVTPIRVELASGWSLRLTIRNRNGAANVSIVFAVNGYSIGGLLQQSSVAPRTPYSFLTTLTEDPFPMDQLSQGAPI